MFGLLNKPKATNSFVHLRVNMMKIEKYQKPKMTKPMKTIISLLFFIVAASAYAQIDPVGKNGLAIGGYDLVAYFKEGAAKKGIEQFTATYEGANYFFTTSENQKSFVANPAKYLPQYEGYCALAVSYGKKISIDPLTFKVTDDKLYLFYNGKTSNGKVNSLQTWNKNEEKLLKKANANWPDVKKAKYKPGSTL
jgi:YHS domain-containing protein